MIPTDIVQSISFSNVISRFKELTGWAQAHYDGDNSSPILFHAILAEYTCQHEQDWMCFYSPEDHDEITEDQNSLLDENEKCQYDGKDCYNIYLGEIIQWLVLNGELPDCGEFLVRS